MLDGVSRIAKLLASNELKNRKIGYKYVCELMKLQPGSDEVEVSYTDILGVCKGLYYSLWMQDKLLLQEDAVARIVKLVSITKNRNVRSMYIKGIFETLTREWENLDIWRQDKFMMLVRDFFVECIVSVKKGVVGSETFASAIFNSVLNADINSAVDLKLHLIAVIKEEFVKAGEIPSVINTFFKKTLLCVQTIPNGSAYSTDMVTLLIFLAKQISKYPNFPLGKISEEFLVLSTKVPAFRKTFFRVAKILHVKKLGLEYKKQKSASEVSLNAPETPALVSISRKRSLSPEELSAVPSDVSVPNRKRPKNEIANQPENENVLPKENSEESVLAHDGESFVPTSEPFKDSNFNITGPNLDTSVLDGFGQVCPQKRVSFGKVFCKQFSSAKKLSAKSVPLLTAPSRGILRR